MRIPLSKYGLPEVVVYPAAILGAILVYPVIAVMCFPYWARGTPWSILTFWAGEFTLVGVLIWVLSFFRDPRRDCPSDANLLLAPADGRVTDIEVVENDYIQGQALRIGIFLSIFNTHINRAPCNAKVVAVTHKPGEYINAMNVKSGQVNESNDVALVRTDTPNDRLLVRQISGAIARRIVCTARPEQVLVAGEKFGMIKFGSRTELYIPHAEGLKPLVQIGDKVKAGLTPLLRYELCES
jgi:phosphatidylserine decarboxylase